MEIIIITSERFKARFLPRSMSSKTNAGQTGKDEPVFWWEAEALIEDRWYSRHVRFFVSTRKTKYDESGSFEDELFHPITPKVRAKTPDQEALNNAIINSLLHKACEIGGRAPAFPLPRFDFRIGQKPEDGCDTDIETLAKSFPNLIK